MLTIALLRSVIIRLHDTYKKDTGFPTPTFKNMPLLYVDWLLLIQGVLPVFPVKSHDASIKHLLKVNELKDLYLIIPRHILLLLNVYEKHFK